MLKTAICDLFNIKHPIVQGGMAWIATAELASAVSNAGGLGIIGTGNSEPDWVRQQIRLAKQRTHNPFGVNIMLASPFVEQVVGVVLEERVAIVTAGAGSPEVYLPRFKQANIKVMPVVASVALARRLERAGADAIVAEGMESGGHIGKTTTMVLVPQVVDSVKIPVVAAGGIGDGRGLAAALILGAEGIQMGTRFVCSDECVAHPRYKQKILRASDNSVVITGQLTGHPVHCLQNKMTRQLQMLERKGASKQELEWFGAGRVRLGLVEGDINDGSLLAGQVAGLLKKIKPVKVIMEEIVAEAEAIIRTSQDKVSHG